METTTIAGKQVRVKNGMVTLPIKEYERLVRDAIPTEYLSGKEAIELDRLVEKGLAEYKAGKTKKLSSLADLR